MNVIPEDENGISSSEVALPKTSSEIPSAPKAAQGKPQAFEDEDDFDVRETEFDGRSFHATMSAMKKDRASLPSTDPMRFAQPQQYLLAGYSRPPSPNRPMGFPTTETHGSDVRQHLVSISPLAKKVSRPCSPVRPQSRMCHSEKDGPTRIQTPLAPSNGEEDDIKVDTKRLMEVAEIFSKADKTFAASKGTTATPSRPGAAGQGVSDKMHKGHGTKPASEEIHEKFMTEVRKCVSRPASARARHPRESFVHPPASVASGSSRAKARPKSAPPITPTPNPEYAHITSTISKLLATPSKPSTRPNSAKKRPTSAPGAKPTPAQSAGCRQVSFNAEEALVVRAYFRRKISEASQLDQDVSHYRLTQLNAKLDKGWDPKAFSVEKFIKDYARLAKESTSKYHQQQLQAQSRINVTVAAAIEPGDEGLSHAPIGVAIGACEECGSALHATSQCPQKIQEENAGNICVQILQKAPYDRNNQEIRKLFRCLRPLKAFEKLSDFILGDLCRVVRYSRFEANRVVFKQGDPGTAWYIILTGSVSVLISKTGHIEDGVVVRQIPKGNGFGDLALVTDAPRSATIITDERSELIKVEKDDYCRIVKYIHEKENIELYSFIRRMPVFSTWSRSSLMSIVGNMKIKKFQHGEVIYKQGDELKWFYIVKSGHVSVQKTSRFNNKNASVVVGILHPLDYFGEEGVLASDGTASGKAKCTVIAGDIRRMSKLQLEANLVKDIAEADLLDNVQNKPTKGRPVGSAGSTRSKSSTRSSSGSSSRSKVGCEVIYATSFEVRQNFRTVLELSAFTLMDEGDILAKFRQQESEKRWLEVRRKAMDAITRENRGDPNSSVERVRMQAITSLKPWMY
ncbi:hypothetical protein HDU97_004067 [Phlyctochytrium planicorne]|nr:hypothetical protein HDU97_004067 [Phlyctochytrium planicorne]